MAKSNIETSFQNLVNVIKEKTYPAASGAAVENDITNIKINIADLGISKIGISQIGMANGVASLGSDGKVPEAQLPPISSGGDKFKVWRNIGGTNFYGNNVWTDGTDIYMSNGSSNQWVLTGVDPLTWTNKTWNGYTNIIGDRVWTDGTNIYYSNTNDQYVLDKSTNTWSAKTWNWATSSTALNGKYIWTDGIDVYYSNSSYQYVLDKATSTWSVKTWTGLTQFIAEYLWTDGTNIYFSYNNNQYVLDVATSTWSAKTWAGVLTKPDGRYIWTDGENIYQSDGTNEYVYNKSTNTWLNNTWIGGDANKVNGSYIWTDGTVVFFNNGTNAGECRLTEYSLSNVIGVANGLATLDTNAKLNAEQTNYVSTGRKSGTTVGNNSTAEGYNTTSSAQYAHAEGNTTQATASAAHAEGTGTKATSQNTHAEGWDTTASSSSAHSEGYNTTASGNYSHAEGRLSKAQHSISHAEGYNTQTGAENQHVQGQYNVGKSTTAMEIGWGTSNVNRINIFEVYQNGDVVAAGDITDGSGNTLSDMSDKIDNIENALDRKANAEQVSEYGDIWNAKTWGEETENLYGSGVWTDGDNIYLSAGEYQYILDKTTGTWSEKTWHGLTEFSGSDVWTDGDNIYLSSISDGQYVLDKTTSTWSTKTWSGVNSPLKDAIWTDGENIYMSQGPGNQFVLNKSTSTWSTKTWNGYTNISGIGIWTDGDNIYYSAYSSNYVLDKATDTWSAKTWTGLTDFTGCYVWTDGNNIYYSEGSTQYILNKSTSTWSSQSWTTLTNFDKDSIWTDGENIYCSKGNSGQYELSKVSNGDIIIENSVIVKSNGDACDKNGNKFATMADIPSQQDLSGLNADDFEHLSFGLGRNIVNAPDSSLWYIFTQLYGKYGMQTATYYGSSQGIKYRKKNEGTWGSWVDITDTNVHIYNYRNTQGLNANDLTDGLYIIRPSYTSNMPANISDATSYTVLFGFGQSDEAIQFLFNAGTNMLFFRRRYSSWQSWTSINFT